MKIENAKLPELRNFIRDILRRSELHGHAWEAINLIVQRELLDVAFRYTRGQVFPNKHNPRGAATAAFLLGRSHPSLAGFRRHKSLLDQAASVGLDPRRYQGKTLPPLDKNITYTPGTTKSDVETWLKFHKNHVTLDHDQLKPEPPSQTPEQTRVYMPPPRKTKKT